MNLSPQPSSPPACLLVAGRRGSGKTRWLQARIRALAPAACSVLVLEEGRTRWDEFARSVPRLAVERLFRPCVCCPAAAGLAKAVRRLTTRPGVGQIFIELPSVGASDLLAEFDRNPGWPRQVVFWEPRAAETLMPAEALLAAVADLVVPFSAQPVPFSQ